MSRAPKKDPSILPEGKLPTTLLEEILTPFHRRSKKDLVLGPSVGVDVGVVRSSGRYIVTSSDPITGASTRIGWHAVHVSANDVATSGIMPSSLCVVSLFPRGTKIGAIRAVMNEIGRTSASLGIAVVGGHTEITSEVAHPIVTVTCFGSGRRFVSAANAKARDSILMTKTAGIEGTSILSQMKQVTRRLDSRIVMRARSLIEQISVVEDARIAISTGGVHAMHDVTEGGVVGAVMEMARASKLGFDLQMDSVPLDESTSAVAGALKVDPMKLIGSGSLLIACRKDNAPRIIHALNRRGIQCREIGRFVRDRSSRAIVRRGAKIQLREDFIEDELWRALREYR